MAQIAVIGTGYVGLTTGAHLAHLGHTVVCADVVEAKVALLNEGRVPIVEPGLEELICRGLASGRLSFVTGAANAVAGAEFVFLCLPTPPAADGAVDLSFLLGAVEDISAELAAGVVVITKSTVPIGSARRLADTIGRPDVFVASNPEFLREGSAVHDCLHPARIVIGGDNDDAVRRVADLYLTVDAPVLLTDAASAETIKYAANAFLATKLSFINAIATLCERVGADLGEVVRGLGPDPRIGFECLEAGPGWGGPCFAKDARALIRIAEDHGYDFGLLRAVIEANAAQFDATVAKVVRMAGGSVAGKMVGVLGLAFKAGTDDVRGSPALEVIRRLAAAGAAIQAYDPAVTTPVDGVTMFRDAYGAARDADVLVVLTEWPEFAQLDLARLAESMVMPRIVDTRNVFDAAKAVASGFIYQGTGRVPPGEAELAGKGRSELIETAA